MIDGGAPLVHLLEEVILPNLTAEQILRAKEHYFHKSVGKWRGGCPWHKSKSGTSFTVTTDSLLWWCQGCHIGDGPVQYRCRLKGGNGTPTGKDFVEIVEELTKLAGVESPQKKLPEKEIEIARQRESRRAILQSVINYARQQIPDTAREYVHTRGFPDEHIDNLNLCFYGSSKEIEKQLQSEGHSIEDVKQAGVLWRKLEGFILFPWNDAYGNPLTIYGTWQTKQPPPMRDVPTWRADRDKAYTEWSVLPAEKKVETPWVDPRVPKKLALPNPKDSEGKAFDQTKRSQLYFDRSRQAGHKRVVLVEGFTDAALLQVQGDSRVVACVSASVSKLQAHTMRRHGVDSVTICLDPDQGGENGILSCIRTFNEVGISSYVAPKLPDGLDPDEFVLRDGIEAWRAHIEKAIHGFRYMAPLCQCD